MLISVRHFASRRSVTQNKAHPFFLRFQESEEENSGFFRTEAGSEWKWLRAGHDKNNLIPLRNKIARACMERGGGRACRVALLGLSTPQRTPCVCTPHGAGCPAKGGTGARYDFLAQLILTYARQMPVPAAVKGAWSELANF
jgi:hypothetical protein